MADVLVAGAGPAGWAIADACARQGLRTVLVAPRPHAAWRQTYGMWLDETAALPPGATYVTAHPIVIAGGEHRLPRDYAVLDNESLRAALTNPEVTIVTGRVHTIHPNGVTLADGQHLPAALVINATGATSTLTRRTPPKLSVPPGNVETGGPPGRANGPFARDVPDQARTQRPETSDPTGSVETGGPPGRASGPFVRVGGGVGQRWASAFGRGRARSERVEQTAYGVLVSAAAAEPVVAAGGAVFMDWRQPLPGPATFLYAVPVPGGRVLLEETSLAARPGLGMAELRRRLHARLATHGIPTEGAVERVRFPVDVPMRTAGPALAFGAAAGLTHPATGYGVADMIALAPRVAEAIRLAGPADAYRAARAVLWSPAARAVHRLRRAGLATLLALPPEHVPEFFALFFSLPAHRQRAYLSGRADLAGTAAAMAALFRAAPWSLRRTMALRR